MSKKKHKFEVYVMYFKESGKFYTEGQYKGEYTDCGPDAHPCCYMNDVVDEFQKWQDENRIVPGLAGPGKEFYVVLDSTDGHPVLLKPYNERPAPKPYVKI